MKNKVELKRVLLLSLIISLLIITVSIIININLNKSITNNYDQLIFKMVSNIKEKYPDVSEDEIVRELLKDDNTSSIVNKYSLDISDEQLIKDNEIIIKKYIIIETICALSPFIISLTIFIIYESKKNKKIKEIIYIIEQINKKNYKIDIDEMSEDELSILKNEIYKTTIMLKSEADNSKKDKLELKDSLSDISHQLKTPLTSILILLDNLLEEPDMEPTIREDFIRDIKREIININFLVQSLLKLSKLDTNTVNFNNTDVLIKDIIDESIKKVSVLSDLKNITIEKQVDDKLKIKCDEMWQVEAITNIIKNCIEHSYNDNKIIIKTSTNKVYTEISIQDFGEGIDPADVKHIFQRFYKAKNSNSNSIGIGLSLSKSIIEKNNGTISVESKSTGTTFKIKYYK